MDEIASVGIKIDTSDIDGAIKNLDALAGKGAAVDKSLAQIEAAAGRTGKSLDSLGKSAGHAAGMDATAKGAQQAAAGLQGMARGLDGVTSATRAAAQEQEKLAKILAGGAGQFTQAEQAHIRALMDKANQLRMTGAEYERYAMAQRGMSDAAQTLGGAIRGQINALKEAERSAAGAGSAFAGIAVRIGALAGAFFSLQKMMSAAEEWTAMNNRLKLVTQGTESFAAAQKSVIDIANSSRQSLSATAELYQRLAMNQAQLGLSGQEMAGVVKTISQTMAISGTSAQSASAALVQLGQAFAAGTLRGDELNSVLEQAPALAEAIAKGMGKTVGELRAMGKEGQLTSEAVVNALKSQAGAVQESFEKMTPTIGQALTVVGNRFVALVGKLDDFTGASAAVAKAVQWAGQNMETLAVAAASVVAVGFTSWASAAVAGAGGLAAATLAAAGGFGAMATAAKAFIASLGPIGWVTLAVGALATAVVAFQDELRGTGDEAVGLMDILGGLWEGNAQEAEKAASAISQSNEQAAKDTRGWWEKATVFLATALDTVVRGLRGMAGAIAGALTAIARSIYNTFAEVFNWISAQAAAVANVAIDGANAVVKRVGMAGLARVQHKPLAMLEGPGFLGSVSRGWEDGETRYWYDKVQGAADRAKERNRQQSTRAASAAQQEAEKLKAQQAEIANQKKAAEADEMRTKILMELNHVNRKQVEGIKEAEKALEMGAITADEYRARVNQLNEAAYKSSDAYKEAAKSAKSRARAGDGAAKQAEREAKAYQSLVRSIQSKTAAYENAAEAEGKTTEADKTRAKILEDVASGRLKLTAAQQQALEVELQAMAAAEREAQWLKESKAENAQRLQAEIQKTDALKKQVAAQKEANEKFGLSAKALTELEAAKYRDTAATARRMAAELEAAGVDSERARQYREQADALDALADSKLEAANKEAQKAVADEWQRTTDQISQSLTDALLRGFEDGKGFAKNFRDTLKNMFRTLVLKPIIQPVVNMASGMLSMLMSGMAGAAQGGAGGGLGSMGGFNFGGFGNLGGMLGNLGQMFANGATLLQQGWSAFSSNLSALWANGQYGSAFASGAGAAASALGGIFGGRAIGQALSGGYSAWGRSGNSATNTGTAAGMLIGNAIPGIGPAIGALIGGALGGVVNRLFGRKLKDSGIEGTFGGEEGFTGRSWKYYKGGWFRSNKTRYEALDEEVRQALAKPYMAMREQLRAYAEVLNLPTDKLGSMTHSIRLSLQGLKPEEVQQRFAEALGAAQEAMAEAILQEAEKQDMAELARHFTENFMAKAGAALERQPSQFRREGETAVQTLERMAASLGTVNNAFALLGRTLIDASLRGGDLASRIVEQFGQGQEGRNAFSQAVGGYYQNFYSETERRENARRAITQQIQELGLQAPDLQSANARAQFRALVDSLDLTTDAGRRAFAALMRLQGAVAEVTEAAEDATQAERRRAEALKEALDAAQKATDAALSALEKAIDRQIGSLQTALQAAQDLASEARSVMQTAHAAARQLYGQTGAGHAMLAAQGQAFIRHALTSARAGVLPDATELSRAIEAARGGLSMDNYATVAEYERDQLVMAGRLQEIGDKAGGQLTLAEQQVAHLKTQIDLLTQQKEYWREQLAAMRGQGETLMSIDQALDWLRQKMQAEREARRAASQAAGASVGASASGARGGFEAVTSGTYDAATNSMRGARTTVDLTTGIRRYRDGSTEQLSPSQLERLREEARRQGANIPRFASGGWHRGGLALVGEEGPELVHFAQPARIYNSADTRGMLAGGSGSSAEVAALRQEVAALRALLERIADASQRSADTLRNVTSETGGGAFAMMEVAP